MGTKKKKGLKSGSGKEKKGGRRTQDRGKDVWRGDFGRGGGLSISTSGAKMQIPACLGRKV